MYFVQFDIHRDDFSCISIKHRTRFESTLPTMARDLVLAIPEFRAWLLEELVKETKT